MRNSDLTGAGAQAWMYIENQVCTQYDSWTVYLPPHFIESRLDVLHALMREHPLAALVALNDTGLVANHVPMRIQAEPASAGVLRGHIARANPLWKEYRNESEALAIFQGPQTYISPALYPSKHTSGEVVPTWNYAVVHARGTLTFFHDAAWLRRLVASLTDEHEAARAQPWKIDDAPPPYIDKMLQLIVGFELQISSISGKWKLGQNRTAGDRQGLVEGLRLGSEDSQKLASMLAAREP